MLQQRWFVAFLVLGLIGNTFGQDKKPEDKKPEEKKAADKKADEKPAGDTVDLRWKFEKDKPFYQEMTTETKQTMMVMGMTITQNQKQTFFFSWTPKEQEKDKNWVIKQKIEGIKLNINIGDNKVEFDSTKETGAANPLADFFKALVSSEFTLTISPDYKVVKIEGRKEFIDKLATANPQMKPMLEQILSDESLKQMADPAFAVVPNQPVKKGDKWSKDSKLNMGPIGTYDTKYEYTYEGKVDKLDKISVKTALTYAPPADGTASQLPFKIKKAELKSSDTSGTVLFDNDKGRLVSSEMGMKIEGKLNIEIGGMTSEVDLSQEQKTTVKTTDENPLGKK